jgi:hypothetical protein
MGSGMANAHTYRIRSGENYPDRSNESGNYRVCNIIIIILIFQAFSQKKQKQKQKPERR